MGILLIFAIGLALAAFGSHSLVKYSPSKWLQADAIVTRATAKAHANQYWCVYTPHVSYKFVVGSQTYNGETYAFSSEEDAGSLEVMTGRLNQEFAVGTAIRVWYQAGNPFVSCIKLNSPYSRSHMKALVVAGVLLIAIGTAIVLTARA